MTTLGSSISLKLHSLMMLETSYDHHMLIVQATARTFSISAIWIFESHLENVLALRAFWRVDKANGWSHCPRQVSSVLPSPIAMAEALWMHSLQYRWPLELKREQNNQWGEISCRFCRQVEALLPERFYNFQQQLKLEKKYTYIWKPKNFMKFLFYYD
jgi:hypothetical protein